MIHAFDADRLPDSDFEPGRLAHLVVDNRGRLLDPRRTPVRLVAVDEETGHFVVEIEAFEDRGARWEVPFEEVGGYQFRLGSPTLAAGKIAGYRRLARRLSRPMRIECEPRARKSCLARLRRLRRRCGAWLEQHSRFLAAGKDLNLDSREGPELLQQDLRRFMEEHGVGELERQFAQRFVSNPSSGELVKGHRIVLAELGLVPYSGTVVRSPELFDAAPWTRAERALHLLCRLAFLREVFGRRGRSSVVLYRSLSCCGAPEPPRNTTFVSATFDFEVARSFLAEVDPSRTGVLYRQVVPVERLFMTYLETAEMNRQFQEAEAVLLWDARNAIF